MTIEMSFYFVELVVFFVSSLVILRARSVDSRALFLGAFLCFAANAYGRDFVRVIVTDVPLFKHIAVLSTGIRPECLIVLSLWCFAFTFPHVEAQIMSRWRRILGLFFALSFCSAAIVLPVGIVRIIRYYLRPPLVEPFESYANLPYWSIFFPQMFVAILFLVRKCRDTKGDIRRRHSTFVWSMVIGLAVPASYVLLELVSPAFRSFLDAEPIRRIIVFVSGNSLLALFPILATYTVLAHRVLDVRSIARSALQHMLARYSATILSLIPFGFLTVYAWRHRELSLAELFSGTEATWLVLATILGLIALRYRQPILDAIDRRFFRERYNARLVLTQLADQVRGTRSLDELALLVGRGVDLALHVERVALMSADASVGRFVDPLGQLRPLDQASRLVTMVQSVREPLAIDFEDPNSPLTNLSEEEKHWLVDGQVEMLAPAYALDASMIGVLALGAKRSELPFLKEDRDLLKGVCSAAGLVIELLRMKGFTPVPEARLIINPAVRDDVRNRDETARECLACHRVYPPADSECPNCTVELEPAMVPFVLRGQFRFEHRLGTGGMAIVYRATDLKLGRTVAIKTLPRVTPEAAMRLHREARTAASVTHPGLAAIYGLETWQGMPMLILELLSGGTLADQLMQAPIDPIAAIDMARTVAQALHKIHTVGILHRDVKPSNIGYTEEGHVKLLDFGIARIQHDFRHEHTDSGQLGAPHDGRSRVLNTASWALARTRTGQLVGTVSYLSPEAVRGDRPDLSFDLWSLAVVLYESLTAENLFIGRNFQEVLNLIREVKIPDIRRKVPGCPEPLALLLAQELHADRSRRAADGMAMALRLDNARSRILG